jgi:hypothetical protein
VPELHDLLGYGVAAVISAALIAFLRRRHAAAAKAALRAGRPLSFECFLRADAAPYPRRWRYGWVSIGVGLPTWKPRFSLIRPSVTLPASATVEEVRRVNGIWESIVTNPDCWVIVAHADQVTVRLAVLKIDLVTALQALASGSGGGWRVPVPHLEVATVDYRPES